MKLPPLSTFAIASAVAVLFITIATNQWWHSKPTNESTDGATEMVYDKDSSAEFVPDVTEYDGNDDDHWPKVAWLMSYPDSGTTYTLHLVRTMSQKNIARNHGAYDKNGNSVPLYADVPAGPFINQPTRNVPLPDRFILTKTHCGGRGGDFYVETPSSFKKKCLQTKGSVEGKIEVKYYGSQLVGKAVHLVRNPFNNLVSHNHFDQTQPGAKNDAEEFQARCREQDKKSPFLRKENRPPTYSDLPESKFFMEVPCHQDVYKYVQWHNYAIETTKDIGIPVHVLHYEDYADNFNKTVSDLMSFLEIEPAASPLPYKTGHSYIDYYTEKQRKAIRELVKELSSAETWSLVRRYFD